MVASNKFYNKHQTGFRHMDSAGFCGAQALKAASNAKSVFPWTEIREKRFLIFWKQVSGTGT
jgi:hypothetical protein